MDAILHATFLETAVQSRTDIGRLVQASQEAFVSMDDPVTALDLFF
jgi:hypothetical protein